MCYYRDKYRLIWIYRRVLTYFGKERLGRGKESFLGVGDINI